MKCIRPDKYRAEILKDDRAGAEQIDRGEVVKFG
jgi:hypothetical protein